MLVKIEIPKERMRILKKRCRFYRLSPSEVVNATLFDVATDPTSEEYFASILETANELKKLRRKEKKS